MRRAIACFLLGALCSWIGTWFVYARQVDNLYLTNKHLLLANENLRRQNEALKKEATRVPRILAVRCVYAGVDPETQLELEKALMPLLEPLIGLEIESISAHMVRNIVDGREIPYGQHNIRLRVTTLIIAPDSEIHISCSTNSSTEDDEP